MKKIAILADSGCQMEIGTYEDQGIFIVPLTLNIGNDTYFDMKDISPRTLFERMETTGELVTTSQPSTGLIQEAVHRIIDAGYEHIIVISIGSGLSSTINGMKLGCDMLKMPSTLIDTKATALNHKYLIKVAKTLIEEGKNPEEIKTVLTDLINESGTLIMAPNLEHLKKSGRLTPAVAVLANLLKIVPVMKLDYKLGGKVDILDKVRTIKKANLKIVDHLVNDCHINNEDYVVGIEHVLSDDLANQMKEEIIKRIGDCDIYVGDLATVVGGHVGKGGVGYQYIKKYKGNLWNG